MTPAQFLGGSLLIAAAGAALAWAAASVPQLYTQFALPGDTAVRKAAPVIIDSPLTFAPDSNGRMHLGVSMPLVGLLASGCTADANQNLTCPQVQLGPMPLPAPAQNATDEVIQPGPSAGQWTLAHHPIEISHMFCLVDGSVRVDFTISGTILSAPWDASKPIKCTYGFLP